MHLKHSSMATLSAFGDGIDSFVGGSPQRVLDCRLLGTVSEYLLGLISTDHLKQLILLVDLTVSAGAFVLQDLFQGLRFLFFFVFHAFFSSDCLLFLVFLILFIQLSSFLFVLLLGLAALAEVNAVDVLHFECSSFTLFILLTLLAVLSPGLEESVSVLNIFVGDCALLIGCFDEVLF